MNNVKLGFMASGRGSNMLAIINACKSGRLSASPVLVISNNQSSGALEIARSENIDTCHLSSGTHPDPDILDRTITEKLREKNVGLVILAGYMKKIGPVMLKAYKNRILNIHPSLLPRFGGHGMYGLNVHAAVLEACEKETGVTVHLVNDEYDAGQILAQRKVRVEEGDSPESLATRVLEVEHALFVDVLDDIITGKIRLPGS